MTKTSIKQEIQTAGLKIGLAQDFFNIFEKIIVLDSDVENTLIFYAKNVTKLSDASTIANLMSQLKEAFPERKILVFDKHITIDSKKYIEIEECGRVNTKPCMVCGITKAYFMTNFLGIRVCEKCIEEVHNKMQNAERKC